MKWFDRPFAFALPVEVHPCLIERLRGLLPRVWAKVAGAPDAAWTERHDGRWSAQENLGHLTDLEALWQGRLDDFAARRPELRPADLDNRATEDARHNDKSLDQVVDELAAARWATLARLVTLPPDAFGRTSRHPRLAQPMRLVDHLFFMAEHDDHHLARIHAILGID